MEISLKILLSIIIGYFFIEFLLRSCNDFHIIEI